MVKTLTPVIPSERIENKIYLIRGKKVMFDRDLADLYGVTTGNLNKTVKRNGERFPGNGFMFQLSKGESEALRFQIGSLKRGQHARYLPYVFTELGVAMLSSVLKSKRAIQINIHILRVFTRLRELATQGAHPPTARDAAPAGAWQRRQGALPSPCITDYLRPRGMAVRLALEGVECLPLGFTGVYNTIFEKLFPPISVETSVNLEIMRLFWWK